MAVQIQLRRGTAAAWTSAGPTLAEGEIGYETDTGQFKFGDGSTAWTGLGYYSIPAATLLTAIKTVDGTGSGLDADLLDGISSAAFAQLATLALTTTGNGASLIGIEDVGTLITATTVEGALAEIAGGGVQHDFIDAGSMQPNVTNGAFPDLLEMTTNKNVYAVLRYDSSTQEGAQIKYRMPPRWDGGSIYMIPVWMHEATATNFGVVWSMRAVAIADDGAGDVAFGTAQTSADTGGTTYDIYEGPVTSAITPAGSPAGGQLLLLEIRRDPSDGSDTMAIDALLIGFTLVWTNTALVDG